MKKLLTFSMVFVLLLLLTASSAVFATDLKKGDKAPAFEVTTMDGKTLKSADFAGKVMILHFWKAN